MIRIITDSVGSLPKKLTKERNIEVASLFVTHKGKAYVDADMDVDEFYSRIADMVHDIPASSQPSRMVFDKFFEEAAKAGDSVLGVFISQLMSGTFESAEMAARDCKRENPSFECTLIDSTTNSSDESFAVLDAADARDAGKSLEDCAVAALNAVTCSRFLFTPETMAFLQAGGRIGKAAAILGDVLKIAPILTVTDGESALFAKVRTRKKALTTMFKAMKDDVKEHGLKRVVVHYIGDSKPAFDWARDVIEPFVGHSVPVLPVSPVIGVHVGPAVGVAYECETPIENKYNGDVSELVFAV